MTTRFISSSALLPRSNSELHPPMATSSSFRLSPPTTISLPFHSKIFRKSLLMSKPPLFSSISIERLLTKVTALSSFVHSDQIQSVETLPPKLQEIVRLFQSVKDPKTKFEQLFFYAKNLSPLEDKFKTNENKVKGCLSQVWVRAFLDPDKKVHFEADSDALTSKGFAALLVRGRSGLHVSEILSISPSFFTLTGLELSSSRSGGFLNTFELMQLKASKLCMEAEERVNIGSLDAINQVESLKSNNGGSEILEAVPEICADVINSDISGSGEEKINSSVGLGSRGERIKEILMMELSSAELEVEDISHLHDGHDGFKRNVETHFNVKIVSKEFDGKSLVKRHRLVHDLLHNEFQTGLHAISIVAKTPSEANGR